MRASRLTLIAAVWIGIAGAPMAAAQTASGPGPQECGPFCRFFRGLAGPAPAETAPAQTAHPKTEPRETEAEAPPRPRGSAARRAQRRQVAEERRARRPARIRRASRARPAPAAEAAQQTASAAQPHEILFVSGADEAHRTIVADLGHVLAPEMTVRTIVGRGTPLRDLLALPGVDATVTSSLTLARGSAEADRLVYLAKLFTEELHALAGPGIARLEDLDGKPVYLGPPDSDSEAAASAFLQSRGITVTPAGGSWADAVAGLREGHIAAAFVLAPKPFAPIAELGAGDGLHFLPLVYRSSDAAFHPAALGAADYPNLLEPGARVETLALDAILVAPRWRDDTPRQQELAAFADRLFERLDALNGAGRHPKWKETNLAAEIGDVRRLRHAQRWVAERLKAREASRVASPDRLLAGAAP